MEETEEIESFLKSEIEKADKEFLEKLKNAKDKNDKKESEKSYKEKLGQMREKYEEKCRRYSEQQREITLRRKNKPPKKEQEKIRRFKVKKLKLKSSWKESLKFDLIKFRLKIKTKNFFRKIMPLFLVISYLKVKFKIKRFFSSFKKIVGGQFSKIKAKISVFLKDLAAAGKNIFLKIYPKIKKFFLLIIKFIAKLIGKIKKKKTEGGKKDEKDETERLIEKILNKKE